jgi:hypothetical protein
MKPAPERPEKEKPAKLLNASSKERARLIRQIWKEGQERATASIMEARRLDKEKVKIKLRKSR